MNELYDYLLMGILIIAVIGFTVWFGSWIDKEINNLLNINNDHDEHEEHPGI